MCSGTKLVILVSNPPCLWVQNAPASPSLQSALSWLRCGEPEAVNILPEGPRALVCTWVISPEFHHPALWKVWPTPAVGPRPGSSSGTSDILREI